MKVKPGGMVVTVGQRTLKWMGEELEGDGTMGLMEDEMEGVKVISLVNMDAVLGERKGERFC